MVSTGAAAPRANFDQQPIEAQAMVSACLEAYRTTSDFWWYEQAQRAFDWFIGWNDLGLELYSPESGGCGDGLHVDRVNGNQGAESTSGIPAFISGNAPGAKHGGQLQGTNLHWKGTDLDRSVMIAAPSSASIRVHRTPPILEPDQSRVLLRPFSPGGSERMGRIISRIMSIPEDQVGPTAGGDLAPNSRSGISTIRKLFLGTL